MKPLDALSCHLTQKVRFPDGKKLLFVPKPEEMREVDVTEHRLETSVIISHGMWTGMWNGIWTSRKWLVLHGDMTMYFGSGTFRVIRASQSNNTWTLCSHPHRRLWGGVLCGA